MEAPSRREVPALTDAYTHDFFICHASEDKDAVARPIALALTATGFSVWYDEFSLRVGDSLRTSIERGLATSRWGVVVLSPMFFGKRWPQNEVDGLWALEGTRGKVILPMWHNVNDLAVAQASPMLADRLGVSTEDGIPAVVRELVRAAHEPSRPVPQTVTAIVEPNWAEAQNHYSKAFGGVETYLFIGNTFARETSASIDEFRAATRDQRLLLNEFVGGWPWTSPPFPEGRRPEWLLDRSIFAMDPRWFWCVWRNGFAFCTTNLCWEEGRAKAVGIGTIALHLVRALTYACRLASALSVARATGVIDWRLYSVKDWALVREQVPRAISSPRCAVGVPSARAHFDYTSARALDVGGALLGHLTEAFCYEDGRTARGQLDWLSVVRDQASRIPREYLQESTPIQDG